MKEKITNRKDLESEMKGIMLDCWLDFPYNENLTEEENMKMYNQYVYDRKLEILKLYYDICLDEEDALNNSENKWHSQALPEPGLLCR